MFSGVAGLVDITPSEPGAAFGNAVYQCKIVSVPDSDDLLRVGNSLAFGLGTLRFGRSFGGGTLAFLVKSAMRGSSISYRMRPMFSCRSSHAVLFGRPCFFAQRCLSFSSQVPF